MTWLRRHLIEQWESLLLFSGGILWVVLWAHRGSMPVPPPGSYRPGGEAFDAGITVALLQIMAGLTSAYFPNAMRLGLVIRGSLALMWVGLASMGVFVVGSALDADIAYVAFLWGVLAMFAGLALFLLATLRARVLPRSTAVLLILGAVLFAFMNPDDRRAFLAVPFGVAWAWLGYTLWLRTGRRVHLRGPMG